MVNSETDESPETGVLAERTSDKGKILPLICETQENIEF